MDSSRSGLLSTILMTLPLIVVPAVALLRPPGSASGVSTVQLDASEDDDIDVIFDDFDGFESSPSSAFRVKQSPPSGTEAQSPNDDFLFRDDLNNADQADENQSENFNASPRSNSPSSDPFIDHAPPKAPSRDRQGEQLSDSSKKQTDSESVTPNVEQTIDQLNALGALRTIWFIANDNAPIGFAAFFRGQTELTRIRFEAVGQSREESARNVLEQVTRWQQQN